jgi:hypothetical protein
VQGVVPHPEIAPLLREHFVALAVDADEAEDEVVSLMMKMPDAQMLPFVIFTDPEGNFLTGSSGAVNPAAFKQTLEDLIADRP